MAYKQQHLYGYRDSLEKGDDEKVIKGQYFDDEFSAIQGAFDVLSGGDSNIDPDDAAFGDVVFQNRTEDQQVVSKFTFAVAGQEPLTVENTGIWAGANYVKYVSADTAWKISPDLDVEGDLTVNGNIIIDGGTIVDPDGNPSGGTGSSVHIGENPPANPQEGQQWMEVPASGDAVMWIYDDGNGGQWLQHPGGKDGAAGADGNIADGTVEGEIATWHVSGKEWTPDPTMIVMSGKVGVGGQSNYAKFAVTNDNAGFIELEANSSKSVLQALNRKNGARIPVEVSGSEIKMQTSGDDRLTIDSTGVATFSGNVSVGSPTAGNSGVQIWGNVGAQYLYNPSGQSYDAIRFYSGSDMVTRLYANGGIYSDGDATFSGTVTAGTAYIKFGSSGGRNSSQFGSNGGALQLNNSFTNFEPTTTGVVDLGATEATFKDAHFSGTVNAAGFEGTAGSSIIAKNFFNNESTGCGLRMNTAETIFPINAAGALKDDLVSLGNSVTKFKDAHFSGTVNSTNTRSQRIIQDGSPVIDAKGLITTLSTLRNATKDETTLEGLRDAIGNAIGGLIEEFENQIATMPAGDES